MPLPSYSPFSLFPDPVPERQPERPAPSDPVYITSTGAHVVTPYRPDLATLIPHAREVTHEGKRLLVIPNGQAEAKLARNVGLDVPAPILTRYGWRQPSTKPPWNVQKVTAALLSESPRAFVLSTMGTGKTRSALYAADFLCDEWAAARDRSERSDRSDRSERGARRWLVVSALSTLSPVWEAELWGAFPNRWAVVLYGERAKRRMLLNRSRPSLPGASAGASAGAPPGALATRPPTRPEFYIINHHGIPVMQADILARMAEDQAQGEPWGVIIDEIASAFRNKSAKLWSAMAPIVEASAYCWGMTGSPTPTAPSDAWAQIKLVNPSRTTRTMSEFRSLTMQRVSQFRWVPRKDAAEIVHGQMQPSVRFSRDDIAELPPTLYTDRAVTLDPEAKRVYDRLFREMRTRTEQGLSITAANEGVLQSKLMQVACGYVYTDKPNPSGKGKIVYALPNKARLEALEELLAECDPNRKRIVFAPYVHALEGIAAHLHKLGYDTAIIHGAVGRLARDGIFKGFQHGRSPQVIVAHPQCMAHGLTLTAADTVCWYAPTSSLEIYEQANARIIRPGQTARTLIAHLVGTNVERAAYARLRARSKMQGLLLSLFQAQELDF